MQDKIQLLAQFLGAERVKVEVKLSDYFSISQPVLADGLYIATSQKELVNVVKCCRDLDLPFRIFGAGTSIDVSSGRYHGLIIKNRSDNIKISGIKGKVSTSGIGIEEALVEADSGVSLTGLVKFATEHGLRIDWGEENLDGTIGGVVMSGHDFNDIKEVKILNNHTEIESQKDIKIKTDEVILSIIFKLQSEKGSTGHV